MQLLGRRRQRLTVRQRQRLTVRGRVQDRKKPTDRLLPINKMTEKYARNEAVPQAEDIAKRTYYLTQDTIRIDYQVAQDRLTSSYRIYTKDGHRHTVEVDPLALAADPLAQVEQFQQLLIAEKDCMAVRLPFTCACSTSHKCCQG